MIDVFLVCLFWLVVGFTIAFTMAKGHVPRLHWRRPWIR